MASSDDSAIAKLVSLSSRDSRSEGKLDLGWQTGFRLVRKETDIYTHEKKQRAKKGTIIYFY